MKYNRVLALILAFAILLGCTGFVPAYAATSGNDSDSSLSSQDSVTEQIQAPQYVDAEQFAQADHTERLYDEEQMNTYVYRNQDGSKSVYYMGQNVKYQHKDGTIREKDTTLVRADRGYHMRDNDVDLHLPDSPADGITLAHGSNSVKLLPQGGSGSARLSDNSILYAGYFGGKTILRYTPMLSGVKEDIILVSYTGQNSFAFVLETGGLYLYETKGQYYLAESEAAEAAFYLGQVVVYDAMGRPGNGSMTVETLISGQKYCLTLSADIDFLTDPETVYPVTIDPTLTVSYSVQGVNAIEDAPIYEGKPNSNYSNYVYDRVGYYDDEYKTARTVMRPAALLNSTEWQSIGSGDITSLKLYIKESSSKTAKQVNIHALTGNSTWTETNVKWSNVGAYSSTVYASANLGNGDWAEFNLTTLAKAWKNGTQNAACGILLKLADESVYRTFYACEYITIDYRPYMVLEYKQDLVLNFTKKDIDEGSSITLTATTQLGVPSDLTWSSNTTTVAKVSPSGNPCVVTALKAGKAIITATATDADGETISATCIVYVKIPDGTYYICNAGSGLCMANFDSTVNSNSVYITNKNTSTVTQPTQFWEITYTHDGWYVIRPVDRPLAVLTANSSGGVMVQDFPVNATIQIKDSWAISWSGSGYVLKHKGVNALTASAPNIANSNLQTSAQTSSSNCRWNFSTAVGVVLRDTVTQRAVPSGTSITIDLGQTYLLSDLGMMYDPEGDAIGGPSWTSTNSTIANFSSTGSLTPSYGGVVTLTVSTAFGSNTYTTSFNLTVILPLSGYELDYEPDLWNYTPVINNVNCYGYALNIQTYPDTNTPWYKQQPGQSVGTPIYYKNITSSTVISHVQLDSSELSFVFEPIDRNARCRSGCYKVALVIATGSDYHWYRQNSDGTWSHKLSTTAVTNLDGANNIIYDPVLANHNYTNISSPNYSDELLFFEVSPCNFMYSQTFNLSLTTDVSTNINSLTISQAANITAGMSYEQLVDSYGIPHRWITSSYGVAEYHIVDGSRLIVYFTSLNGVLCVESIKKCLMRGNLNE